ncbi:Glycoside hydrolase family 31 protein [Mycena sanguinolenta]|uniref:beta-glucosidase n=1 Tax=Mycena sanguinolenta TaxID=230812 RepID=A0A8H6YUJ9_9AGAR|nr:Glycoside hydrolase family 31 protein [Mycena sanguinolenta]
MPVSNRGMLARVLLSGLAISRVFAQGTTTDPAVLDACPGYTASNVKVNGGTLTASLTLAGKACNVFGTDIASLSLEVVYETVNRIHVKITDPNDARYEVPESVLPRPSSANPVNPKSAAIKFNYTTSPFTFAIQRTSTNEVLFSTASHPIIFEPQYLRVKTNLGANANIYGLGEHTNDFRLDPDNTTLTLWSRDAYGVPTGTNFTGRRGTHAVLLLSSNGMDIKLTKGALEYNVIGGVLDFYFLAGSTTDPTQAAIQYAEVVGLSAEVPYWSFGLHQCRFGYQNYIDVADVISNYSIAKIPLETMWTDIDYMDRRRIFTVDPDYFPLDRMREIVEYLHGQDQHYVLMTDPAVGYLPGEGYGPFDRGTAADVWLKNANGSDHLGLVWPGVTVWPDWFSPNAQDYWNNEFNLFYNPETGLDIDGAWIDMNEPSSFCDLPCDDPFAQAIQQDLPPARSTSPPPPDAPIFQNTPPVRRRSLERRDNLLTPQYSINNAAPGGNLSSKTAYTDTVHANNLTEYDAHNLFGTMMSVATHGAMLARRPGLRTLVITRSTFVGAGAKVGKWLGDNFSDWEHYRNSIAGMLGMATLYQVPMVGADICGYAEDTTDLLCARWAMLGAFYPFMRNHNADTSISQEFYRWPVVAQAAQNVLDIRYRLMDYIYTAFHTASLTGAPVVSPMWFKYPKDTATYPIDLQWFFGDSILVSPVTEENSTSVSIYVPNDIFYDFLTLAPIQGHGAQVQLTNVSFTEIPVYIKGGAILPLRANSTMTTAELREVDFEFVVAPGTDGTASGSLYVDDGGFNTLTVTGSFAFKTGVNTSRARFLNVAKAPSSVLLNGAPVKKGAVVYNAGTKVLDVTVGLPFTKGFTVTLH